jgi:hypothetical protein
MESFRKLYETDTLILGHTSEQVVLLDKKSQLQINITNQYGDPTCGLIVDNFCIIGGHALEVYNISTKKLTQFSIDQSAYIFDMKIVEANTVRVLTDPWSSLSAVWELDVKGLRLSRVRDFSDYMEKPYSDAVVWR